MYKREMLFKFLACIVQEKNKYKDCKHLLILKILPANIKISFMTFLSSHWSISSCVNSWLALEIILRVTGSFHANFRITGFYQKDETSFQKRVTGKIFTVSK
jgi:hypothetical protein